MPCSWRLLNHRYEAVHEIARSGSLSSVYLVRDLQAGKKLTALKVSRLDEPKAWSAAREEFETLRRINHPRVAEVYSLGRVEVVELPDGRVLSGTAPGSAATTLPHSPEPGDAFLTFEYIDGLSLRDAFLRLFPTRRDLSSAQRWTVFYQALASILQGLECIHAHNLVHHDIKPENLLLIPRGETTPSSPAGYHARIIDFGLAQEETTPQGSGIRGTVPYIAPEIVSGAFADRRSDLYSVGISVVHSISGGFPFPVDSLESWMETLGSGDGLPIAPLLEGVPGELVSFLEDLTAIDPDRRIPSAPAALDRLEVMGGAVTETGSAAVRGRIPTVGWERELELIRSEIDSLGVGESSHPLVLVEAEQGVHVHRLVEEVEVFATLAECSFNPGRARRPARSPYHAITEALRHVVRRIGPNSPVLRKHRPTLALLLPVGESGPNGLDPAHPPAAAGRAQLVESLAEFLMEAARDTPIVMVLEDLHLADGDTLDLLAALSRQIGRSLCSGPQSRREAEDDGAPVSDSLAHDGAATEHLPSGPTTADGDAAAAERLHGFPGGKVLIVAVWNRPATESARFLGLDASADTAIPGRSPLGELATTPSTLRVELGPLDSDQLQEWLRRRYPGHRFSRPTIRRLFETSGGAPRFVDEIIAATGIEDLSGHAPRNVLRWTDGNDARGVGEVLPSIDDGPGDALAPRIPASMDELVSERLERLQEDEQAVLEVMAASRAPLLLERLHGFLTDDSPTGNERADLRPTGNDRLTSIAPAVRKLLERSFLQLVPGFAGPEISWFDDSTRAIVSRRIPAARGRDLHRRLLESLLLEANGDGTPEAAFHALNSGNFQHYTRHELAAADRLVRAHSRTTAAEMLEEFLRELSVREEEVPSPDTLTFDVDIIRCEALHKLGRIYRDLGEHTRALEKLTVLLSHQESQPDFIRQSGLYRLVGEIYDEKGDHVNALYFLEKNLRLPEQQLAPRERIETLLSLSRLHYRQREYEKAETAAQRALDSLGRDGEDDLLARTCLQLGAVFDRLNDQAHSLTMNLRALESARRCGNLARTLETFEALGNTYMARAEYEKAIEYFSRGIELAMLLRSRKILAKIYNHVGTIHFNRANHVLALENFHLSLDIFKEIGDQRWIANCHNNIGLALCVKDDLAGAAASYRKAIEIFTITGDEYGQAAGMNNLALILELEGEYHDALEYSFRSLDRRKQFNSKSGVAFSYYRIGKIYRARGELDKADSYAEKALDLRREIGEKMGVAHSMVQFADLLLPRGHLARALSRCQEGEDEFEALQNHYGRLVARETRGRILLQIGEVDAAVTLLNDVLSQARQGNQQLLAGRALLTLAVAFLEREDLAEAGRRLDSAETTFRNYRSLRELVELHLTRCRLELERRRHTQAGHSAEKAYGLLEELGIRDLIPYYFLLRGRLELEGDRVDLSHGKKFLERALVEARETSLPDVQWRVRYHLGVLESRTGNPMAAAEQFRAALETLDSQARDLSEERIAAFHNAHVTRTRLLGAVANAEATLPGPPGKDETLFSLPTPASSGHDAGVRTAAAVDLRTKLRTAEVLNQRLLKLQEINKALNSELDIDALLEKVMDAVLDLVDGERGFLIVKVGKNGEDTVSAARNLDRKSLEKPADEVSHSITAEVLRTGKPILTTNATVDGRFAGSRSVRDLRLLSVLCVPLRSVDEVLGAIYVDNRHRPRAFGPGDLRILESFCDQATTAIINARLSEEIQKRNRDLTEANRQTEELNQKLVAEVKRRTSEFELTRAQMQEELSRYQSHLRFGNIIGKSRGMQQIFQILEKVAPTGLPVLVQGESGTGKELIARALHANSTRKDHRFISENCAALSESLLESELFGHTRGAFTGATANRKGLFELASGGTLFLDEVAEMSFAMQKKLLRVLQEGEIRRVGGKNTIRTDVRVVSASNQDLVRLVEQGRFREDLYYRLNGVRIDVPSLRDRKDDVPLLARHFLEEIAREANLPGKRLEEDALRLLTRHSWPGNVRELRHFLERTALLTEGQVIRREDCHLDTVPLPENPSRSAVDLPDQLNELPLREARDHFTMRYVERCYAESDFNVTRAARSCGMSRESFHRFLKKFGIHKHNKN